jgi:hypothetical protein
VQEPAALRAEKERVCLSWASGPPERINCEWGPEMRPGHSMVHDGAIGPRESSRPFGTGDSVRRDAWPAWHPRRRGQTPPHRDSFEMPSCSIGTSKKTRTSTPPILFQYTQNRQKCKCLFKIVPRSIRTAGMVCGILSRRADRNRIRVPAAESRPARTGHPIAMERPEDGSENLGTGRKTRGRCGEHRYCLPQPRRRKTIPYLSGFLDKPGQRRYNPIRSGIFPRKRDSFPDRV